jgi:hypothetical protein
MTGVTKHQPAQPNRTEMLEIRYEAGGISVMAKDDKLIQINESDPIRFVLEMLAKVPVGS